MTEIHLREQEEASRRIRDRAEPAGRRATSASALRHSFRITFESLFLDLLRAAPAAEKAEPAAKGAPERAPAAPEERGSARDAEQSSRPAAHEAKAPETAAADAAGDAPAAEASAPEAKEGGSPAEAPKGAEAASEGPKEGASRSKTERAAEAAGRAAEAAARLRLVETEGTKPVDRTVDRESLREAARRVREVLEDPEATTEDLLAAIVAIAEASGVPAEDLRPALEAAGTDDGAAETPHRLRRALERIERILSDSIGESGPEERSERAAPKAESDVPAPREAEDPLERLVRKVERAAQRAEAQEGRAEERPAAEAKEAPAPDVPRFERRSEEAARRPQGPQIAVAEAAQAVLTQVQAAPQGEAGGVAGVGRARLGLVVRATAEGADGGARAAAQANAQANEGRHFAFGEYGRNESQRAKNAPEARPSAHRSPVAEDVFREVIRRAKVVSQGGRSEATIELKPEFLGRLTLKVAVEEGRASVKLHAENAAVRGMLEANLDELRKALVESGLEVETLEVAFGGAGFGEADADREGVETERRGGGPMDQAGDGGDDDIDPAESVAEAEALRRAARRSHVSLVA